MIKAKPWKGNDLKGDWLFCCKIDGVRALPSADGVVSRAGKPLYNLEGIVTTDSEVFLGSWEDSVSAVRTQSHVLIDPAAVYSLEPLDPRLEIGYYQDPDAEYITEQMELVVMNGYEGLILRQGDVWLKVKPVETFDVEVVGTQAGTGKYTGKMGALLTPLGKVGTGFKDHEREPGIFSIGDIIEVSCMSLTPDGKFRHPRFVRHRVDK